MRTPTRHTLWQEGSAFELDRDGERRRVRWDGSTGGMGFAVCSCGAHSPDLTSGNKRRQWHREHKAEAAA